MAVISVSADLETSYKYDEMIMVRDAGEQVSAAREARGQFRRMLAGTHGHSVAVFLLLFDLRFCQRLVQRFETVAYSWFTFRRTRRRAGCLSGMCCCTFSYRGFDNYRASARKAAATESISRYFNAPMRT